MEDTFIDMVKVKFQFLADEYDFKIVKIQDHIQYNAKAEGYVEYQSPTTFVTVTGEWYWNGVAFGRAKDARRFALTSELVHEYLSLRPEERKIVCSADPKDARRASLVLASKRLPHVKQDEPDKLKQINGELAEHARQLQQYADPFLKGDFSRWLEMYEYLVGRMVGEHRRARRSELSLRYIGEDENGKAIHKEENVFQGSFDYLAGLRAG